MSDLGLFFNISSVRAPLPGPISRIFLLKIPVKLIIFFMILESIKKFKPVITLESWLNHKGQININETKKRYLNLIDLGYEFHHIWGPDFLFIPK